MRDMGEGLTINAGSGGGHELMAGLLPTLAAIGRNPDHSGGFGGGMGIWAILLLALLRPGGFGAFGECGRVGAGAVAAAGVNECGFLQLLNGINGVDKGVAASTAAVSQAVDIAGDRVIGNLNVQSTLLNNRLTETNASIASVGAGMNTSFANLNTALCNSFAATNANITASSNGLERTVVSGFSGTDKALNCGFNQVNSNLFNGFSAIEKSFCQLALSDANQFSQLTAQNSAIMTAIQQLGCKVDTNTQTIICNQNNLAKDAQIAALQAEANEHRERANAAQSQITNTNIVGSTIQQLLNSGVLLGGQGGSSRALNS